MIDSGETPSNDRDRQPADGRAAALQRIKQPKRDWRSTRLKNAERNIDFAGRPQESQSLHLILDAAIRCFLPLGYAGTSMDAVAKEAGVARRTVYYQFASKEALFRAAIAHVWRNLPIVEITRDRQALIDPEIGLVRIGRAIAGFWASPHAVELLRMVIAEETRFPELARSFVSVGIEPMMATLVNYLDELKNINVLSDMPDVSLAAEQLFGLINEPLLWSRVLGVERMTASTEDQYRVVESAVILFLSRHSKHRS